MAGPRFTPSAWLDSLLSRYERSYLSEATGITTRTLYNYEKGVTTPRGTQYNTLRSLYKQLSRDELINAGLPSVEASRFSGSNPDKISRIESDYQEYIDIMAAVTGKDREMVSDIIQLHGFAYEEADQKYRESGARAGYDWDTELED